MKERNKTRSRLLVQILSVSFGKCTNFRSRQTYLLARLNYKSCLSSKFRSTVQKFLRGLYVLYFPYRERSALSAFLEHLQGEDSLSGLHCPTGKCYFIPFLQRTGFYPTMNTVRTHQHLRPTSNFQHTPT